ncbi:uncharacterized protein LOC116259520 isoform X2 [Nymphaea colorata]|uniref:uncharacterized protein LOC116259520 isoform X2 n=1 Tax=Nymphaea colorata TaxID=210225 RepID=UPI00129E1AA2|nr:uncharacterized protein LOC116259520 isoform X2 [Nymphaea colorata]
MAPSKSEEEEEEYVGDGGEEASTPFHLPYASPSEIVDSTSTIDPSYIIHLIRQLLPCSSQCDENSKRSSTVENSVEESHSHPTCNTTSVSGLSDSDYTSESFNHKNELSFQPASNEHIENEIYRPGRGDGAPDDVTMSEFEQDEGHLDCARDSIAWPKGDLWEESACMLWDLSTDKSHAELMVQNFLLDVILGNLSVSTSVRKTEICLGILANLACHGVPRNVMLSKKGLTDAVTEQLFTIDSPCLYEAFRLFTSALQSSDAISWAKMLEPVNVLEQILSVTGNTLNQKLLEKSIELLLSMVDSQPVADLLLPSLMHLGLPSLLVDLLESEIRQMASGNACDRDNILDMILQVCEVLSLMDVYSAVLFSNKKIFLYACAVVKHCDKDEIGSSCVTATVLLANLISDEPNLAEEISKDFAFLHGLLDILPLVSDDYEASSAFWSLFARLLIRVSELMNPPSLRQYASLLAERSVLIAEAVENHLEDAETRKKNSTAKTAISYLSFRGSSWY